MRTRYDIFQELMQECIVIKEPTPVYWRRFGICTILLPDAEPTHQYKFCVKDGILVFHESHKTYVTTSSEEKVMLLSQKLRFSRYDMQVPFANGDEPGTPELKAKWDKLMAQQLAIK